MLNTTTERATTINTLCTARRVTEIFLHQDLYTKYGRHYMELEKWFSFDICVRDDFNLVTLMLARVMVARFDVIFE